MTATSSVLASISSPFLRQGVENIGEALPSFSWDVVKMVAHYWGGSVKVCGRDAVKKIRGKDIGEDPELTWKQLEDCHLNGIRIVFRIPKCVMTEEGLTVPFSLRTFGTKFRSQNEAVQKIIDIQLREHQTGWWGLGDVLSKEEWIKSQENALAEWEIVQAEILAIGADCSIIEREFNPEDDQGAIDPFRCITLTTFVHSGGTTVRIFVGVYGKMASLADGLPIYNYIDPSKHTDAAVLMQLIEY